LVTRPLLVVPYVQREAPCGRRVVVAWNGSPQAARAVSAALPLLRRADSVTVASFGTPDEPAEPDPDIAPCLKRHGVEAELVTEPTPLEVGDCLLSLVADRAADLLVMGGYGRARLRETLLGGLPGPSCAR
jgi:nucleotide-binding universal stress UspA family protein